MDKIGAVSSLDVTELCFLRNLLALPELSTLSGPLMSTVDCEPSFPIIAFSLLVDLEAYYKFNSDGLDASINGRDLTYSGTEAYVAGKFGDAYDLPGVATNFAQESDDAVFEFSGTGPLPSFSIQAWVDASTIIGSTRAVIQRITGTQGWALNVSTDGRVQFAMDLNQAITAAGVITTGAGFQHIIVTADGTSIRIYVDGVLENGAQTQFEIDAITRQLGIGARTIGPDFPWDGALDEIAIWSRALTDAERLALYAGGFGREI